MPQLRLPHLARDTLFPLIVLGMLHGCGGAADYEAANSTKSADTPKPAAAAAPEAPSADAITPEPPAPDNPRADAALTTLPGFQAEVRALTCGTYRRTRRTTTRSRSCGSR